MTDTKPPCLTVLGGPMAGHRFLLEDGVANVLIGAEPVCAFHLPLPGVSAMHARLSVEPNGVTIWEAGSPRGLHVNDSRVEGSGPLRNGDIVWLGTPGDADVVMLQVILPRLPAMVAGPSSEQTAEEAAAEEAAAEAAIAAAAAEAAAVEGETVALDPRSLSLEPDAPSPAVEPEAEPAPEPDHAEPDHGEPMSIPFDSPLDAHFAQVAPTGEPEEAGVVVDVDAPAAVDMSSATLIAGPDVMAGHDFVLADEGVPPTVAEPASPFTPPAPPVVPPAPRAPIPTPPGFEDETEDKLVEAEPEAQTLIVGPDAHEIEPAYLSESDFTLPPTTAPVAPARVTPPPPTPAPAAAPAKPAAAPAPARPTRPAAPPTPSRKPAGPSVSQRTEPAERPPAPAAKAKSSSSAGLYVGLGLGALVVIGGGVFAVMKMRAAKPAAVAQTPPPVMPTAAPTPATVATPLPLVEPTPEPAAVETPPPVVPTPVAAATPAGRPTPSPSPTKPGATPTPAPVAVATPAGPSPEQLRAQQVAGLLTQAESAMGAHQYDQAVAQYDEALKLDPGNARATSGRAGAVASRDAARRRFVSGRTVVTTEKAVAGGLSGFEGAAVQKAPDFLGRIEFEMSPASGLKAGDPWTLKLFVVNEGKKPIRITDLTATTVVNGERSGGAGAKAREIAPQARVQVGEMAGAWKEGTQTWAAEVLLTAKGDSLKNTLTWK